MKSQTPDQLILVPKMSLEGLKAFPPIPSLPFNFVFHPEQKIFFRIRKFSNECSVFFGDHVVRDSITSFDEFSLTFVLAYLFVGSAWPQKTQGIIDTTIWEKLNPDFVECVKSHKDFEKTRNTLFKVADLGDSQIWKVNYDWLESVLLKKVEKLKTFVASTNLPFKYAEDKEKAKLVRALEFVKEFLPEPYFFDFANRHFSLSPSEFYFEDLNKRTTLEYARGLGKTLKSYESMRENSYAPKKKVQVEQVIAPPAAKSKTPVKQGPSNQSSLTAFFSGMKK